MSDRRIEIKYYTDDVLCEDLVTRFNTHDMVYIVQKKRGKIHIIEDKIDCISFTNIINYKTMNNGYFQDRSKNIFDDKEDAYDYAEKLNRRANIKFKSFY